MTAGPRILKFLVDFRATELRLPTGAKVLHVGHQPREGDHVLVVWAECDFAAMQVRQVRVVATGEYVPDGYEHVGTVQIGEFVWHLYQVRPA